jgi:cysteine-rich repeat protein
MHFRTIAFASAVAAGLVSTATAFVPHKGSDTPITAASARQPRLHRTIGHTAPATAQLGSLAGWQQLWDRDTDVPLRMWGPSLPYFASTADAATGERAATDFLAAHLAVLAPGSAASDFVVVANQLDPSGTIRTVGFQQSSNGVRVEGGTIGITFERDHLVMVSSTALPNVAVRMPAAPVQRTTAEAGARAFLASENISTHVTKHGDRVIVPMIFERGTKRTTDIAYRVAETVEVEADRGAGRWDVWVDANDGAAIARKSLLHFATGTVDFDVPDRYPLGTRHPQPAPQDQHMINGVAATSDLAGVATFTGATPAIVVPGLSGPLVAMTNHLGALVSDNLQLTDGGSVTWSHAADPQTDAQLDTFVFVSQAKAFVRARLNPNLAWLDEQLSATVNETMDQCNAYSTGDDIHFYKETAGTCENTGRIADVVYHEFGHSVHNNSIIEGEGAFDSSLSEGLADTLAVSITGDHGMGRGFYFTDAALRDVDPVGVEKKWPDDADGEPHDEGEIIGEALYDLRKALQTKYGDAAGFTRFLTLYYGVMQRSVDIPSSYAAALVADDDNGNLADGVPDQCAIDTTFALHGLANTAAAFHFQPPTRTNNTVSLTFNAPSNGNPECPPPTVSNVTLSWKLQGTTGAATDVPLTASGTTYSGDIPAQAAGSTVLYHVTIALSDGTHVAFPDNKADPDYQMYIGAVTTIECFDFENGFGDWTHTATPANRDEWEVGPPLGLGGDPATAHGGANVLGVDLSKDGQYRGGVKESATSPAIDLMGYTNVHLQYYRWLDSEDAAYDPASIIVNGSKMFENFASPGMPTTTVDFTDKEWRFADVDLSGVATAAAGGPLTLTFEQDSDRGINMGGWTVDDVCIVALADSNPALCGNNTIDPGEQCDDGNTAAGDGCSAMCQPETTACADGSTSCGGGGCCSTSRDPSGAVVLSLFTVGLVLRRRRRR